MPRITVLSVEQLSLVDVDVATPQDDTRYEKMSAVLTKYMNV